MAGPLTAVERFFERLFERPAARLFQARIEPIQIQRGLERAIESERRVHARQAYAPAHFRVLLSQADVAALAGDQAALVSELAEQVRAYARAHGYVLLARPSVQLQASTAVAVGDVRVFAEPVPASVPPKRSHGKSAEPSPPEVQEQPQAEDSVPPGQGTSVFAAMQPSMPRAQLAVRMQGQPVSRLPVRPGTIRIGRALDNDIVLPDEKISRHHGQIGIRLGMLVYSDLASTNGSFLNGAKVSEIALGPGDVLQLGSSTVTVEPDS